MFTKCASEGAIILQAIGLSIGIKTSGPPCIIMINENLHFLSMGDDQGPRSIVTLTTAPGLEDDEVLSCVMQSLAVAPLLDIASDMDIQVLF